MILYFFLQGSEPFNYTAPAGLFEFASIQHRVHSLLNSRMISSTILSVSFSLTLYFDKKSSISENRTRIVPLGRRTCFNPFFSQGLIVLTDTPLYSAAAFIFPQPSINPEKVPQRLGRLFEQSQISQDRTGCISRLLPLTKGKGEY